MNAEPMLPEEPPTLTPREVEVLRAIIRLRYQHRVASELGISARTVEVHLQKIRLKCGGMLRAAFFAGMQVAGSIQAPLVTPMVDL